MGNEVVSEVVVVALVGGHWTVNSGIVVASGQAVARGAAMISTIHSLESVDIFQRGTPSEDSQLTAMHVQAPRRNCVHHYLCSPPTPASIHFIITPSCYRSCYNLPARESRQHNAASGRQRANYCCRSEERRTSMQRRHSSDNPALQQTCTTLATIARGMNSATNAHPIVPNTLLPTHSSTPPT